MAGLSIFPQLTQSFQKGRPERLLLLCYFDHRGIATVPQNISFLQRLSKFEVDVYNFAGCEHPFRLPASFDLAAYTGVVLHNSLAYNVDNLRELDANLAVRFKNYGGVKVIFKQDENYKARGTAAYLGENKFDVVFTCLPESERQKVYPREVVGDLEFTQMLTGYVTPDLRDGLLERFGAERDIDVGYRGSLQPLEFGRLCYEKQTIGRDFLAATQGMSLRCDISSRWEDRFSGDDWLRFLCRCKGVLGVESGASIFDLDGDVKRAIEAFKASSRVDEDSPEYPERLLDHLKGFEGNVYYNQISPRHFEAAATKTLQIMFEGKYSNILVPGKHFVELKRDFSNAEDVVRILRDDTGRETIVEAAYRDIIVAPTYWMETFVAAFDKVLEGQIEKKSWAKPAVALAPLRDDCVNVLLLCAHHPDRDPRIDWIQRNAPAGMVIHVLGVQDDPSGDVSVAGDAQTGYTIVVARATNHTVALSSLVLDGGTDATGESAALSLAWMASMSPKQMPRILGISEPQRILIAQSVAQYFLNTAAPLANIGACVKGIDAIIACDLETLLAAVLLKQRFGLPVMYDAHEFWPDSDDAATAAEFECWLNLERRLLPQVDDAVTVTPGLADYMSSLYGTKFGSVPNCEPRAAVDRRDPGERDTREFRFDLAEGEVAFLVQGNFAIGRGFELLIDAWQHADARAKLYLRGPDRPYKDTLKARAKQLKLLGKRIFFPDAVDEADLVLAASFADVGIIPYEPKSINNRHCGPNKLSQYMAAGVPVLSNRLHFVEQVLREGDCGVVADFTNTADIVRCVNTLTADVALRRRLGENARAHFATHYNWNVVAVPFYASIMALAKTGTAQRRIHGVSTLFAPVAPLVFEPSPLVPERARSFAWRSARALWRLLPRPVRQVVLKGARAVVMRALSVE
ncbi:glycosyltransferase [Trinickia mobilis]|uniref:glycosyltransferase n=1 Tax=Trinickia mobilis TaxID=2816356 RepID=UPI001A8EF725|nr:glycosyltransferase [Trinickia mobilis]